MGFPPSLNFWNQLSSFNSKVKQVLVEKVENFNDLMKSLFVLAGEGYTILNFLQSIQKNDKVRITTSSREDFYNALFRDNIEVRNQLWGLHRKIQDLQIVIEENQMIMDHLDLHPKLKEKGRKIFD